MTAPHPGHTVTGPLPGRTPAHAVRPTAPEPRLVAAVGAGVLLVAIGMAIAAKTTSDRPAPSTPSSAQLLNDTTHATPPARTFGSPTRRSPAT